MAQLRACLNIRIWATNYQRLNLTLVKLLLAMSFFHWIFPASRPREATQSTLDTYSELLTNALHERGHEMGERECRWEKVWLANQDAIEGKLSAACLSEWLKNNQLTQYFLDQCLKINPGFSPANSRLGLTKVKEANWTEAVRYLAKALDGSPEDDLYAANLGAALFKSGEIDDAVEILNKAWECNRQHNSLAANLFVAVHQAGNLSRAKQVVEAALAKTPEPTSQEALENAGGDLCLIQHPPEIWPIIAAAKIATQTGDYPTAEKWYRQLIVIQPSLGYSGMGTLAMALGEFQNALDSFSKAIAAATTPNAQFFLNRALALVGLRRFEEALRDYEQAMALRPGFAEARFEHGTTKLRVGDWRQGWLEYEARRHWKPEPHLNYFDAAAEWQGEALAGKTIIVVSEQGQGDVIQFVRFAKELYEQGGTIVVFSFPSLVRLIKTVPGVSQVFTNGEPIPAYDYWVPVASLPFRLGLTLESLNWSGSYVFPQQFDTASWDTRLATSRGLRVGLVWAGGDYQEHIWDLVYRRRNISLDLFQPLLETPGTSFFSLQKGKARTQLVEFGMTNHVADYSDEWTDFIDTANFIVHLDLVITVDTAVAHLAGAMNKPVWILSRTDGCWRWLDRRIDSPWYPSARIFHQEVGESWSSVILRVKQELTEYIDSGQFKLDRGAAETTESTVVNLDSINCLVKGRHGWFLANRFDQYLGRALIRYGEYGEIEHRFLASFLAAGDSIVEIGANIGSHTVGLAKTVGENGKVIAIEAQPTVHRILCANLALNALTNVTTYACGCGKETGTMYVPAMNYNIPILHNSGGISLSSVAEGTPVPIISLDNLLHDLDSLNLKMIKIDVEGMEKDVLQGAHDLIQRYRPILYVENDRVENSRKLIEHIRRQGYRLWWHVPMLFNPDNHFHQPVNDNPGIASFNMICLPTEASADVVAKCSNLLEVDNPEYHPLNQE